jgi:TPP-dependent pyruvate/acetoin dehydrogenase alpha subunit
MGIDLPLLLSLFEDLVLVRECEERIRREYASDEMKTPVHLGIGGEALAVGVKHALPQGASYFATYRNHAIYLTLSQDTDTFFAEMYGKVTGCGKGKAGSMHLSCPDKGLIATSAVVGTTIPVAVGAAFASRYQDSSKYTCVFFGDGATEEGAFWESVNFASLHRLPILFVCEDNELAIHTFRHERQGYQSLSSIVETFDIPFQAAEGWNVEEVYKGATKVLAEGKEKGGPAFLHLPYHRFLEHVGPAEDYNAGYRPRPDRMETLFDPILKAKEKLISLGANEAQLEAIRNRILTKIEASIQKAKAAPFPQAEELYTDVFAESLQTLSHEEKAALFPMSHLATPSEEKPYHA